MSLEKLRTYMRECRNIVFFGGAGVSTESGIPDFRSEAGIYHTISKYGHSPETILSHTFFIEHPNEFFDFYKSSMIYAGARPNKAHQALSELEKKGRLKAVITQNIDGLHQLAGSRNVIELHGSIHRNYCMNCGKKYPLDYILNYAGPVPSCSQCGSIVRPDVTLYEENLDSSVMERAVTHIGNADMLIIGGTSLAVYPAAGLIHYYSGNRLVLINKSPTPYDKKADLVIHDSIGMVLDEAVKNQ